MHGKQRIMEQAFNQALCSVFLKVFSVDVGHFCRSCFRLSSKIYRRARRESAKVQQLTFNENHEFLRWMLKSLTDSDTRERAGNNNVSRCFYKDYCKRHLDTLLKQILIFARCLVSLEQPIWKRSSGKTRSIRSLVSRCFSQRYRHGSLLTAKI
mgnify:CR=1 FL=1